LTEDVVELARKYGRYGYRQVTTLLNEAGWCVNHKRVWRREGLKVPQKQKKRGRLWLNEEVAREICAALLSGCSTRDRHDAVSEERA